MSFDAQKLVRGAAMLITGSGASQVISIVMAPIVARLYRTADYGHLGIFMAVSSIVVALSTLQYQQAVLASESAEEADAVMLGAFALSGGMLMIFALLSAILGDSFLRLINAVELRGVMSLLLVATAASSASTLLSASAIRRQHFRGVTVARVASAIGSATISIALGANHIGLGLVLAYTAGGVLQTLLLLPAGLPASWRSARQVRAALRRHIRFPLFTAPNELFSQTLAQLPLLALTKYWSADEAGSYAYALRTISLPITLVGQGVSEAIRPQMVREFAERNGCRETVAGTLKLLLPIALAGTVLAALFAPQVFALVFGARWTEAGREAQWIAAMASLRLLNAPISFVVFLRKRHFLDMVISVVYAAVTIAVFAVAVHFGASGRHAVIAYALVISAFYCFNIAYAWHLSAPRTKGT